MDTEKAGPAQEQCKGLLSLRRMHVCVMRGLPLKGTEGRQSEGDTGPGVPSWRQDTPQAPESILQGRAALGTSLGMAGEEEEGLQCWSVLPAVAVLPLCQRLLHVELKPLPIPQSLLVELGRNRWIQTGGEKEKQHGNTSSMMCAHQSTAAAELWRQWRIPGSVLVPLGCSQVVCLKHDSQHEITRWFGNLASG